jgi:glyoxylase-like metal-dependent hydrolase (beta-lactamase superfamily II)
MFRSASIQAVLAAFVLSAASVSGAGPAGQTPAQPPPAPAAAPDFSKVEIKTTKVGNNFYVLEGQGGAIGVLAGPDGVLMVDAQFAPLTEKIVAAIKQISDRPIRFLVNTHVHGDHTGGNENLGKMGVTILARDQLRARLEAPATGPKAAPAALPLITYRGAVTFHMNGADVQLLPVPAAHTDGDTMVAIGAPGWTSSPDVIMTGDFFRSVGFPNIDRANGGTLKGLLDGFTAVIALAGPATKIVPGHGAIVDEGGVAAHRDMAIAIRDKVAALVRQGKTQEEVLAAKPTSEYDARVPQPGQTADRFVGQLYAEIKGTR